MSEVVNIIRLIFANPWLTTGLYLLLGIVVVFGVTLAWESIREGSGWKRALGLLTLLIHLFGLIFFLASGLIF